MASAAHKSENYQQPNLLTIPRELRDMIIASLLQSGDLSVLCICPPFTEEALQRINHEATFRVYFNISGHEKTVVERANIPAGIRNFDVRLRLPLSGDVGLEDAFQSSLIRHLSDRNDGAMGRCTFTIDYKRLGLYALQMNKSRLRPYAPVLIEMLYYALSGYTHFIIMAIKVVRESQEKACWSSSPQRRLCLDAVDVQFSRRQLVPMLGPAKHLLQLASTGLQDRS